MLIFNTNNRLCRYIRVTVYLIPPPLWCNASSLLAVNVLLVTFYLSLAEKSSYFSISLFFWTDHWTEGDFKIWVIVDKVAPEVNITLPNLSFLTVLYNIYFAQVCWAKQETNTSFH